MILTYPTTLARMGNAKCFSAAQRPGSSVAERGPAACGWGKVKAIYRRLAHPPEAHGEGRGSRQPIFSPAKIGPPTARWLLGGKAPPPFGRRAKLRDENDEKPCRGPRFFCERSEQKKKGKQVFWSVRLLMATDPAGGW